MPETLSLAQLKIYQSRIDQGGLNEARQVYAGLYKKGYNYAGWAQGVAKGDTLTGAAALDFLKGTALMGLDAYSCRDLSQTTIDSIRYDMARAYLNALVKVADDNENQLNRDVRFDETRDFHNTVFESHNLSLSNWTLNTPMELIRKTEGDAAVEALWQRIRDTGGEGLAGTGASFGLLNKVGHLAFSADPSIRDAATYWMDNVPGVANLKQMGKTIELSLKTWGLDEPAPVAGDDAKELAPPAVKLVLDTVDGKTKLIVNPRGVMDDDVAEGPNTYLVRKGDSLWKIAIDNGWDFDALKAANKHLTNPDFIHVGQRINGLPASQRNSDVEAANL